jgi:hypothetical protein
MELGGQDSPAASIANDGGARPIAKEDASSAVARIDQAAAAIDTDDQRIPELATLQVSSRDVEAENVTGTRVHDIESQSMFCAQLALDQASCGRHGEIGRACGNDDDVNIVRGHACLFQSGLCSAYSQIGRGFINGPVPRYDADSAFDPLGGGIDSKFIAEK